MTLVENEQEQELDLQEDINIEANMLEQTQGLCIISISNMQVMSMSMCLSMNFILIFKKRP